MNCPSRPDDVLGHDDWNQNPPALAPDTTTRADLNGIANSRLRAGADGDSDPASLALDAERNELNATEKPLPSLAEGEVKGGAGEKKATATVVDAGPSGSIHSQAPGEKKSIFKRAGEEILQFSKFIGPGFMVAVAYIDPGNYSTDVSAGATYRFRLLFIILMSNLFAILLQTLCVRLGSVTGLNLAENCKAHLPSWLNYTLYVFAEAAIIATDMAEVIGSAIALNLLLKIPLVAGCAITIVDVIIILLFYRPGGSLRSMRYFEMFVMLLVLGVVICFCIQLSLIENTSVGEVMKGYLPSSAIVESKGLYLSCGILGATVMPHSLYLGSGIVQTRLLDFDRRHDTVYSTGGHLTTSSLSITPEQINGDNLSKYRPSLRAIRACLNYSIIELAICLFTFALFVNSAILITAGASLSSIESAQDADLFDIHALLSKSLAPAAGTIFALALLLSGTSAGIVCTIAGQMVSEGQLNWTVAPWMRRLITRSISITPSIIIAAAVGRKGLSDALNASQVALSVILPFVSAPLIYFTCRNKFMTVSTSDGDGGVVHMRNHWAVAVLAFLIWMVVVVMNVALLVLVGLGKA
ncbi:MAG: hypothetical protein M1814_002923 [Vezdaea aestivalis]|nr:MAG: hypothetical protein M1814_002923 [Vezdaea aestivalis]